MKTIIINGAGSDVAKHCIQVLKKKYKLITISRTTIHEGDNILNFNLNNLNDLKNLLEKLNENFLTWIHFGAIREQSLLIDNDLESIQKSIDINFLPNFYAVKYLTPKMISKKFGRFIFVNSSKANLGDVGSFAYSLGKGCNNTLQKNIVLELSRFNITSNTLFLGYFDTNMWKNLDPIIKKKLISEVPNKSLSDINSISSTIDYLINNPSVNNAKIKIDNGLI